MALRDLIRSGPPVALLLACAGCGAGGMRPAPLDSYRAWLAVPVLEPVVSRFTLRELDGRWWFIAPSGRRFIAVSGATMPESGKPVNLDTALPAPYLTAGIPDTPADPPSPRIVRGLPDPYDDATLPALTDAAQSAGVFADDPFCLGHLAIPGADLGAIPGVLEGMMPRPKAAERWFALRTTGGSAAGFRAEFADRLYGIMASALRGADENHLVFTGWWEPGATAPDIARTLGHWGDVVCARLPAVPDAVRMAEDAHAATGRPVFVWLADPAARAGDPPQPALRTITLDLLRLPWVVGVDTLNPPSAEEAYRRHAHP